MIAVALLLSLDLAYLARGSLELFPTEAQIEKVRVVTAAIAVVLVSLELGLWWVLRRIAWSDS
jgi:hypothetical protein